MPALPDPHLEAMAQEFVAAAREGDQEISRLAILNPEIWQRCIEIEQEEAMIAVTVTVVDDRDESCQKMKLSRKREFNIANFDQAALNMFVEEVRDQFKASYPRRNQFVTDFIDIDVDETYERAA